MAQHYRLRYQVYCVEREFLHADDYPDQRERDEFDADSLHVGAVDALGELAGTARVIRSKSKSLPMFRHCTLFPHVRTLDEPGCVVVEVSRVSISRDYARRRDEIHPPPTEPATAAARASQRRRRRTEPFLTLVKSILQGAKRAGATHLIGATEASFHRWVVHYGFPFRVSGPEADYYGPVVPSILSLHELDDLILSGRFPALEGLPVGWDPEVWPGCGVDANVREAADAAYRSGSQVLHV
jgi:N-acyl amino acid synthase of PEP-CTERM/exosortase system